MSNRAIKWRLFFAGSLFLAPILALVGVGAYHLYAVNWTLLYVPLTLASTFGYVVGSRMAARLREPASNAVPPADYWTPRDEAAWKLVEAEAMSAPAPPPDALADLERHARQAEKLALIVARIYHPSATEPFNHLTLPEVLACCELVAHDLAEKFNKFVPGGHLLSLGEIRRMQSLLGQVSDIYPKLRTAYWLGAAVFNPIQVGLQAVATTQAVGPANKKFQESIVLWFQTVYLKELGKHLIELNSGRLKVGAKRYQELKAQHRVPEPMTESEVSADAPPAEPELEVLPVVVALVGPVKAGKSSLVNALLGEQRAATDVTPLTAGQVRYQLRKPGLPPLTLVDTLGFGNAEPSADDVRIAIDAAGQADSLIVVVPARSAARKPEIEFLARIKAGVEARPDLKLPPIVVALTHADLLTPAMEWDPPYDWRDGERPKEVSMRGAVEAAREQFGAAAVVPVSCVPGREWNVRDGLAAEVVARLGEARGVGFLRAVAAEADAAKARRLFRQVRAAGSQAARVLREALWG